MTGSAKGVVITGIGVFSPIAADREAYWSALMQGASRFQAVTLFDTGKYRVHTAGEITDFDPLPILGKKGLRDLDRSTRLICCAAKMALDDSGLIITEESTQDTGVSIGATFGSLHSISQFDLSGLLEGPRAVNPSHFPNTVINSPASQVSIKLRIKGFNTTISTGFCASLDAISYAADFIRLGRASAVLAGGVEELCEESFMGFHKLGCLSGADGSAPVCRPFDAGRNGTILSEAAAVLVLEEEEQARSRGASVLGRIAGCGSAFDPAADRSFRHAGQGLSESIIHALRDASLTPGDVDYICSGANGTRDLDVMETAAIKNALGNRAFQIPVSAIKSMVGESYSASGAVALAAALGSLQKGFIPPTINYREKDAACDLHYPAAMARREVRHVLVIAADPFGQNTAVIVGR